MPRLVPYFLMPLAAMLGLFALSVASRVLYLIYVNSTMRQTPKYNKQMSAQERLKMMRDNASLDKVPPLQSREFALLFLSLVLSIIAYAFVVARVESGFLKAERALFDPYALLGLQASLAETYELTAIQDAFKEIVKDFHLSDEKDEVVLEDVKLAFQALTDERAKLNYQRFGHPLGELELDAFNLKVPSWLIMPEGPSRNGVYFIYAIVLMAWGSTAYSWWQEYSRKQLEAKQSKEENGKEKASLLDDTNSVGEGDLSYMMNNLTPTSDYKDILFGVCTAPDNVAWGTRQLEKIESIKNDRREKEKLEAAGRAAEVTPQKKDALDLGALIDEGGWDEDEDDGKSKGSSALLESKKKELAAKENQLLEGFDDGVVGQAWVESVLEKIGEWPPKDVDMLEKGKFEYNGEVVKTFMDHPGLRRVLCMTMGRLNSQALNTHPELLNAGAKKLIDQTYFRGSMEFRNRAGLLLEGTLRVAMMFRSYRLVRSVLDTVVLFKIGCHDSQASVKWFEAMMQRQNGCLPRVQIHSTRIISVGHDEIATDDMCEIELDLERLHAENFLKAKVATCQKQGLPPQIALNSYREGWWLLLRCKRLDGATPPQKINKEQVKNLSIKDERIQIFENEVPEFHLLTATPVIVSNIAQQRGKFKVKFRAPAVVGKYRFSLSVKSQDFLGADQEIDISVEVVDAAKVGREPVAEAAEAKKTN